MQPDGTHYLQRIRLLPRDAYYFRGELVSHFAALLDERREDPYFWGDPYARYGGQSLTNRSHGEGFLAIIQNRVGRGLYLLDEPEAALSPQRQLALMAIIADRAAHGGSQFIIATHSPVLMTIPGAEILLIDGEQLVPTALENTDHFQITKSVLQNPAAFWRHLKQ
jgi:predicted ATPase